MVVGSNGAISGYIKSKMAAGRHLGKFHISATAHSLHLYSAHSAVIFAIAQLSCILLSFYPLLSGIVTTIVDGMFRF